MPRCNVTNIMKHNLIEIKKFNYIYLFIYSFFIYQLAITNITNVKKKYYYIQLLLFHHKKINCKREITLYIYL